MLIIIHVSGLADLQMINSVKAGPTESLALTWMTRSVSGKQCQSFALKRRSYWNVVTMIDLLVNPFLVMTGYVLGCLSTGYYLVRYRSGNDVRCFGSGSVGATNVGRLLGAKGFVLTFIGDFGKGVLALALAKWGGCHEPWLALVLTAVVAGHLWPAQLRFKGGKGVATAFGGLIVYDPTLTLLLIGIFMVLLMILGGREFAGMIAFPCMPAAALLIGRPVVVIAACLVLASLLLWAHRENLVVMCGRVDRKS